MATKVWCRSTPGIPYSSSSGRAGRQPEAPAWRRRIEAASACLEGGDDLVDRGEFDAGAAPGGCTGCNPAFVQTTGGILHELHPPAPLEEAPDRGVGADVRGNPEQDDLVGIEPLEQPVGVRVREDVEALLQQQELAALEITLGHRRQRDRDGIP